MSMRERPGASPQEMRFSNRFLAHFRPRRDGGVDSPTEKPPPSHQVILDRTGSLSQVTTLNREVADEFMRRGDMRRDVFIIDSDKRPEGDTVAVGGDVLAWRVIEPITKLTEITFRPKPLHTLTRNDRSWQVAVHERIIDEKVRKDHPVDRSDYDEIFLSQLNKASKSGLADALTHEKLGLHDQMGPYIGYAFLGATVASFLPIMIARDPNLFLGWMLFMLYAGNPAIRKTTEIILSKHKLTHGSLYDDSRIKDKAFFHFGNWIAGRLYLAHNGDKLVVPKE